MRTNIDIDRDLVKDAMEMTGARTMREAVHLALRELVGRRDRKEILRWIGKLDWQGDLEEMRGSSRVPDRWEPSAGWRDRLGLGSGADGGAD
jgi:Arc/MetJ family transcription regulator